MRFLSSLLSATLLVAGTLAAKKSSTERWEQFHAKALSSSPIKLKETSYQSLTASPREYSAVVLLTALGTKFGCQLCREFQPEWDVLGHSWAKGDKAGESGLLFGTLDFADGRDVFMSLNLQTAPVLIFFPPTTGPHAGASSEPLRYDFTGGAPTAEAIHSWISRQLPNRPHPAIKRPIDWMRWATILTVLAGAGTLLVTAAPYIMPIVSSRKIWAALTLVAILVLTSGFMFTHIRKVPYVSGDGHGGISYFVAGFQSQLGLETQIIAAIYGLMSFCVISLAVKVPRIADPKSQTVAVLAWGGVLFLLYSFLLSVFRIKNGSYPFSLPPFM